jgi:hypothetical protein
MSLIPEIKIDHVSWRVYGRSWKDGEENKYIVYNIIFTVIEDAEDACYSKQYPLSLSEEYCSTLGHKYKPGALDIIEDNKTYRDNQLQIWISNPHQILRHIEKFDKFQAREWIEYNPVTLACLEGLKQLKEGKDDEFEKEWQGMTAYSGKFFRLLHTLDTWWD